MELLEILWAILVSFFDFLCQFLFGNQRRRSNDRSGVPFRKSRTRSIDNQNDPYSEIRTDRYTSKPKLGRSTSEMSTLNRSKKYKKKISSQKSPNINKSSRSRKQRSRSKASLSITPTKPKFSEEPDVFDATGKLNEINENAAMDQPEKSRRRYSKSDNSLKNKDVSSSKNLSENDIQINLSEENEESNEFKDVNEILEAALPSIDSQKKLKSKSKSKSKSRSKKKRSKSNIKISQRKASSSDVPRKESIEILTEKTQNGTDSEKKILEPVKSSTDSETKPKSKSKSRSKRRKSKSKRRDSKLEVGSETSQKSSGAFQQQPSQIDTDNVLEKAMKALNSGRGRKAKSSIRSSMKKSQSTPQFTPNDEMSDKSSKSKRGGGVSFREQLNVKLIPVDNKGKKVKRKNKETPSLDEIMISNKASVIDETSSGERYGRTKSSRSKRKRRNKKKTHRRKKKETPPDDEIVLD